MRSLLRTPLFTTIAILSLSLGIGANTAMFSLLDRVLLRDLPVCDPSQLVILHSDSRGDGRSSSDNHETVFSLPMYEDLKNRSSMFDGLVARSARTISFSHGQENERATAEIVSGNFFRVMCVRPMLGRVFNEDEDKAPGANPVAVLTYTAWRKSFGASQQVLNTTVRINGHPFTIIGVLPSGFNGVITGSIPDLLVPISMHREATPGWDGFHDRQFAWLNILGRLKPGVSPQRAEQEITALFQQGRKQELAEMKNPPPPDAQRELLRGFVQLFPASRGIDEMSDWRTPLVAVMAMVGVVLLIACVNVANLLIVRGAKRQKEIAIRVSLGANRFRIGRQLFVESAILAGVAAFLSITIADWLTGGLAYFLPDEVVTPGFIAFRADTHILLFTASAALLTAIVFGLLPAWHASKHDVAGVLKSQSTAITAGGTHAKLRKAMVLIQVALATSLIVLAGLFAGSARNLLAVPTGFHTANVITFSMDPRLNGYRTERGAALYTELLRRLTAAPGVQSAAAANPGPLTHSGRYGNITAEGYAAKDGEYTGAAVRGVSAGYFATLGIPILAGREFTAKDIKNAPLVAVVNEEFARKYFLGANPIGRKMRFGASNKPPDVVIVGLARNYKHGDLREKAEPVAFMPLAQDNFDTATFYVRSSEPVTAVSREIRSIVRDLDGSVTLFNLKPLQQDVEDAAFRERLVAMLAVVFGGLATLLAALGVYGVIAYVVARRTNEFGIRVALGAEKKEIILLVLREVTVIALAGVVAGLGMAAFGGQLVRTQLYGIRTTDPLPYVAAAVLVALIALLAAALPARRAARINPLAALRYE